MVRLAVMFGADRRLRIDHHPAHRVEHPRPCARISGLMLLVVHRFVLRVCPS
jgi:hypothetical protein